MVGAGQQPAAPDWLKFGPRCICSFGDGFSFRLIRCLSRQPVSRELAGDEPDNPKPVAGVLIAGDKDVAMERQGPGGCLGLVLLLGIFAAGLILDIEWMRNVGGIGLMVWGAMFVIGYLSGARG
jgi:hypothetical protein